MRDNVRKDLTRQFVDRELVAIYSRIPGIALVLYCGMQFEDSRLVYIVASAHVISLLLNRHFAHSILNAIERGEDFSRQAHILAYSMGAAAFLWGMFLWTFPQTLLRTPAEFVVTLTVVVAVSLMILTAALNATTLRYTLLGTCLSILPAIARFTELSGYATICGFIILIVVLLAYTRLLERQARGLSLIQLRSKNASRSATRAHIALVNAMRQLREQADRDGLTKMRNRGAFERAAVKMQSCELRSESFVTMLIDLDHFKYINDNFGHTTGDVVLTHIGSLLHDWEKLGSHRISARWGGEEFVVLACVEEGKTAEDLAEELRLRLRVANVGLDWPETLHVSVSIGFSVAKNPFSIEKEIRSADVALYQAKNEGRDCCRAAG